MRLLLTSLVLFLSILTVSAQTALRFSGTVTSAEGQPVEAGDALLLRVTDSSLLKYAPIVAGSFRFEGIAPGSYLLRLSGVGYAVQTTTVALTDERTTAFRLNRNASELQGVTVAGSKRTIVSRNGNTRINVDGSPLAAQPDAVSLLGKLPSLQLSSDEESLSVVGRGTPLIYVENRRITLADLRAIAVTDIKTIEIVNNPSARYEAEGRTVILVTLRHARKDERRLDLSETAFWRGYFTNRLGANALRKSKGVEWKAGLQYNQIKNWERNAYDFRIPTNAITSGYDVTSVTTRAQTIANAGLYVSGKNEDYFSAGITLRYQNEHYPISTASYLETAASASDITTDNRNRQQRLFATANLNWSKALPGAAGRLFVGAQQAVYTRDQHSDIYNALNGAALHLDQQRDQEVRIGVLTVRADWERPLKKEGKLEAGALFSLPQTRNQTATTATTGWQVDDYRYREHDAAAYVQASGLIGKASVAGGLRAEHSAFRGGFKGAPALVDRQQLQLFPKASVSFPVDSTKTLTLSYAKTIQRPDYSSNSGVVQYINPWFDWAGNVNIGPVLTQEVAAQFQYNDYGAKLAWYRNDGPVYAGFSYDPVAIHLRRMDQNYKRESGLTLTLDVPFKKGIWSMTNTLITGFNTVADPDAQALGTTPFLYVYSMNQFKLPAGYLFTLTGSGITSRSEGVYDRNGSFGLDSSVSKTFRNKLAVTVTANNILNSLKNTESFAVGDVAAAGSFFTRPDFALSLRWSVGSVPNTRFRNRDVDENAGRIK